MASRALKGPAIVLPLATDVVGWVEHRDTHRWFHTFDGETSRSAGQTAALNPSLI